MNKYEPIPTVYTHFRPLPLGDMHVRVHIAWAGWYVMELRKAKARNRAEAARHNMQPHVYHHHS